VRVGMHAGPVYGALDPILGQINFFGSHVNRAARECISHLESLAIQFHDPRAIFTIASKKAWPGAMKSHGMWQ
jgi:hypothetical protein